jgi:hypothetical protein
MTNLTGKTRLRHKRGWFNDHLVLQVEESYIEDSYCRGYIDCSLKYCWRDATVDDMLVVVWPQDSAELACTST